MTPSTGQTQRRGNDAPSKAWKTPTASFPLFPPDLEIRQTSPASHIPTAPAARFQLKETGEENMKPKTNSS